MTRDEESLRLKPIEAFLTRLRTWWHQYNELNEVDRNELDRMAADMGLTARDLRDLVARGPDAAALLHDRMTVLGLSRNDVERTAVGLMRDLERTCAYCGHKAICEKDLSARPRGSVWESYCPNAISLEAVSSAKGRFPA